MGELVRPVSTFAVRHAAKEASLPRRDALVQNPDTDKYPYLRLHERR